MKRYAVLFFWCTARELLAVATQMLVIPENSNKKKLD